MTVDEYATLIYYWHGDPHPERIEEMLSLLESGVARTMLGRKLAAAGTVLALETMYPDRKQVWRQNHSDLYASIERAITDSTGPQEWADFHLAQWFITHELKPIDEILDCIAEGGEAGWYGRQVLHTASEKCIPFRYALEKAQKARHERMILNVIQ
jgi:hypothetical protein